MKNYPFTLTGRGQPQCVGTLIEFTSHSIISFEIPMGPNDTVSMQLDTVNIESPANFIATCVRRADPDTKYRTVNLNGTKEKATILTGVEIAERQEKKLKPLWILRTGSTKKIFDRGIINLTPEMGFVGGDNPFIDLNDIGARRIEVPADGVYCKDPVINRIFAANFVPMNNKIDKNKLLIAIKRFDKSKSGWSFFFVNNQVRESVSAGAITVTESMVVG